MGEGNDFLYHLTNEANLCLEEARQRWLLSANPTLVPKTVIRLSLTQVAAVLQALSNKEYYASPHAEIVEKILLIKAKEID